MRKTLALLIAIVFFLLLFYLPVAIKELYLWTVGKTDWFSERAYYVALNMGAEGLKRDGSTFTLRNGKQVVVAFSCVDLIIIGVNTLLPLTSFTLTLSLRRVHLTTSQAIILFLILFMFSILTNIVRIATLLYLATNHYEAFVQPIGWLAFHDTIGFAVLILHTLIWTIIALAIAW